MSFATANSRLHRDLLWNHIVSSGKNICYHCKEEMTRDDFSIEHIKPWRNEENAIDLFFDLTNISYSHSRCNSQNTRANTNLGLVHGTLSGYTHHKCRCDACKKVKAEQYAEYKKRRLQN